MAISARLAAARRTTLTISLCAALAAGAETRHADGNAAPANVILVTSCADDGSDGTLRKAIESAGDGDTIDMSSLSCSLITLQSGAIVTSVTDLFLKGPGIDALTIDGNYAGRVLVGNSLDLSDLTITHGMELSDYGGGCVLADGDLSLTRVRLSSCVDSSVAANAAGGAAVVIGNLVMHESIITASKANGAQYAVGGGAIVGGSATLFKSSITGNSADASQANAIAGGLYANGTITLHASLIEGNSAHSAGGAAYGGGVHGLADIFVLEGSTVSGNATSSGVGSSYGGGISSGIAAVIGPATVTLSNSTVTSNLALSGCDSCTVGGGGIHAFDTVVTKYSTIDNNTALCTNVMATCSAGGGGVVSVGSQPGSKAYLYNSTISANAAFGSGQPGTSGFGGGMALGVAEPFVAYNSTIAFNHASDVAGGIFATAHANNPATMISTIVSNNDSALGLDDISPGQGIFGNSVTVTGFSNIVLHADVHAMLPADTLAIDPGLLPLTTDEGGVTATHPLRSDSAAIDAGLNPKSFACDQRGYPNRRVEGAAPDIGAYEVGEQHIFADNFDGTSLCLTTP